MDIIWDEKKNSKLKKERGISFEEIAALILDGRYVEILEHPKRPRQKIFLVSIHGYIHSVPFVIDGKGNIILKTAFPSRKFNSKYGEKKP